MEKRAEGCRLLHLAKRISSGGKLSGKSIPLEEGNLDLIIESDYIDVDAEELENFFN